VATTSALVQLTTSQLGLWKISRYYPWNEIHWKHRLSRRESAGGP